MADTADLIRRARELANLFEQYSPCDTAQLARLLAQVADELERLYEENKRLRGSTFHPCEQCGRTVMSEDHP